MQEEDRVWIDPESLPPMLQESAGGWHTLMTPGKPAPATGVLAEVNALLRRMKEHLNRDQYKEAVEAYEQLLGYAERHPDIWSIRDADTYAELAKAYYRMGKYDQASKCIHQGWNLKLDEYPHCDTWEEYLELGSEDWTFQSLWHTEKQIRAKREEATNS